jgi:hypothetical protein
LGQLATDSRFLTANPYSFWVRSTGPGGSLPFLEEKLCSEYSQDKNAGQGVHGARAPGYWLLAGPSLFAPHSVGARSGRRTLRWANLRTLRPYWAVRAFLALYPFLTCDSSRPGGAPFEGAADRWHARSWSNRRDRFDRTWRHVNQGRRFAFRLPLLKYGWFPLFSHHTRTVILPSFVSEPPPTLVFLAIIVAVTQLGLGLVPPSKL